MTASDGIEYASFGYDVAVSSDGNKVVVGAPYDDDNGPNSGSVYVYDGINWETETKIIASDGAVQDSFSLSVAISSDGSTLIAGADGDSDNGSNSGSVYIIPLD